MINFNRNSEEQEEIKTFIGDYLTLIFTSFPLIEIQKKNFRNLFKTMFGRIYFARILYQDKFNKVINCCFLNFIRCNCNV